VTAHSRPMKLPSGIIEPSAWKYTPGDTRREAVYDPDNPNRVIRQVGYRHCLCCRKPFFSPDVVKVRLCIICKTYKSE
jgi:hypothetical protein